MVKGLHSYIRLRQGATDCATAPPFARRCGGPMSLGVQICTPIDRPDAASSIATYQPVRDLVRPEALEPEQGLVEAGKISRSNSGVPGNAVQVPFKALCDDVAQRAPIVGQTRRRCA